ncbi:MAG TPA: ATP-binding protein, partial [Blastocatellia bacterium]|nr:ATP-binding protein [Blastocatellia bacterium]
IDVSVSISPIRNSSGKIIGVSKVARDITELQRTESKIRQNEERLRLAVDAAHLGTWDWDINQDCLIWGGYHGQLLGLSEQTPITYNDFLNLVHPEDRAMVKEATTRALENDEEYSIDFRLITAEGNVRWLHDQGFVYRNEQGKPIRMIGVVQDVTAKKRAEVERELRLVQERELREVAEAASRSKDEFLAVISHELRSPLNAMLGWTRVLQGRLNDTETLAHGLEVIERSARSQQRLIEDLLDTARIISGKLRLETGPVDLVTVINNALEVVRPAADARHIELSCFFDKRADLITGDADRLQQVVWNLLSNAIKFTPENGRVELKLERNDPYAQITVSDTGQGIDAEFLPHIFNRFHQADSSSTRRHGGLGLGLALVRHLVELHGGAVSVKSEGKGKGATFTVKLPLRAVRGQ